MSGGSSFFLMIGCAFQFRNLAEFLLKISNSGVFHFNKDGMTYKYVNKNNDLVIEIPIHRSNMLQYIFNGDEPFTLTIDMVDFNTKIKNIRVHSVLRIFTQPDDKKNIFRFQICGSEAEEINSFKYIKWMYEAERSVSIPSLEGVKPDRIISHNAFTRLSENIISACSKYLSISKKGNGVSFQVDGENSDTGAIELFINPSIFQDDEDETKESEQVVIDKDLFNKMNPCKFNKDGIVRMYIEKEKHIIFQFSVAYLGFVNIYIKHTNNC